MKETIDFNKIENYYRSSDFQYSILRYIKHREIAFLVASEFTEDRKSSHRMNRAGNTQQIQFLLQGLAYKRRKVPFNWYMSLAQYKNGIPKTSPLYEYKEQKKKVSEEWKQNHYKEIVYYDYVIDIDSPDNKIEHFNYALETAIRLREQLLQEGLMFFIVFSGRGFHFHINIAQDNEEYDPFKEKNIYQLLLDKTKKYKQDISELIDINIYDSRRVIKIPYSLAIYNNFTMICKPLTKKNSLEEFALIDYVFTDDNISFTKPYIFNKV